MGVFKKRGIGIIKFLLIVLFGALGLYLLFRGIITENIVTGMK